MGDFVYTIRHMCKGIVYFTTNDILARQAWLAGMRVTCKHKDFRKVFNGSNKNTANPKVVG